MLVTIQCRCPVYVQVDTDEPRKVRKVVVDDENLGRIEEADLVDEVGKPLPDQHGETAEKAAAIYSGEIETDGDPSTFVEWPGWQFGW